MTGGLTPFSRRRVITVLAATSAAPLLPRRLAAKGQGRWVWRGTALGAPATLILDHRDGAAAEAAIAACLNEIERLEREFSLQRQDSALSHLNANGSLASPSLDMLAVLEAAAAVSDASGGAFDVTVQPLWLIYARHFRAHPGDEKGPSETEVAKALGKVGYRRLSLSPGLVALPPGGSATMNGIAQGYITDRVADLLRGLGWTHVMIDLGEIYALGSRADGRAWTVAVDKPTGLRRPLPLLEVHDRAIATSSAAGTMFAANGRHHHLFDPRSGRSASLCIQTTVIAKQATFADALSTALFVARPEERKGILQRFPGTECLVVEMGDRLTRIVG
ncbi:MAG: FAD:protein FMN transferase [Rhodospirillales bacterium]|jgi:thiamine biosynthesis lipoprotein|nr:FAD:protein FMN transferase [Rhodospirillales bacterium]